MKFLQKIFKRYIRMIIVSIGKSSSYRFVGGCCRYLLQRGSRDEVSISARRDYAGATNNPRSPEMHLGWKASKRCAKTLTVLTHSASRSLSENRSLEQDNRVRERKKAATIGSAARMHHATNTNARTKVREVGIRIPGHIRPSPASPF